MRVLTSKIASEATISSTNESTIYPASNLCHQFLYNRWQPTADGTQTVTLSWGDGQSMNCVFLGYISDTITNIDIKIYDSGGLVETLSSVDLTYSSNVYYFSTTRTGIITLELAVTGSGTMYIGGCEPGEYYQITYLLSNRSGGVVDNSINSSSGWGQSQQQKIPWLDSITYSFASNRSIYNSIRSKFSNVGTGGLFWIDFYEDSHETKAPGYYKLNGFNDYEAANLYVYTWSIELVEAR